MSRPAVVSLVLILALGPWLFADALFVHSDQSESHWAVSSNFVQGAFFWAVFVLAVASAGVAFARLIKHSSVIAVAGSIASFFVGGAVLGYIWYIAVFFLHTMVFGGSI